MSIKERAVENFKGVLNCAQSVISAYSETLGLDNELARAVSVGFGGGMGISQKTCGAVSGAIIAIGYKYYDKDDIKGSNFWVLILILKKELLNIKKKICLSLNV